MAESKTLPAVAAHGAARLPSVEVDSYNVELKDDEGFLGDRASKSAFTGHRRELAQGAAQGWRRSVRRYAD